MENTVRIVKIDKDGIITAVPVISEACLCCSESSCKKTGKPFEITNPLSILVYEGCVVSITAKAGTTARQTVFAVLFPVLAASAGYVLPDIISDKSVSETVSLAFMLGFMCVAVLIVLLFSKKIKKTAAANPYITGIVANR